MKFKTVAIAALAITGCANTPKPADRDIPVTIIRGHSCSSELTARASDEVLCPPVMVESEDGNRRWLPIYSRVKPGEQAVLHCDDQGTCGNEAHMPNDT